MVETIRIFHPICLATHPHIIFAPLFASHKGHQLIPPSHTCFSAYTLRILSQDLLVSSSPAQVLDLTVAEAFSKRTHQATGVTFRSVKDPLANSLRYISQKPTHPSSVFLDSLSNSSESLNRPDFGQSRSRKKPRHSPLPQKRHWRRCVGMLSLFDVLEHILQTGPSHYGLLNVFLPFSSSLSLDSSS